MKVSLFQGILIAVFGAGALIGIFVFATYSSSGPVGSSGIGAVKIWGTLPAEDISDVLTEIGKEDTSMQDVSYIEKSEATLASDLATAIATGSGPDLILTSHENLYALSKFIAPIPSDTLSSSSFTNAFVGAGNVFAASEGEGFYGVPFLIDPLVLFSNSDILSSNGIAKPPATWEGLIGLVPTLAVITPTKQITRGAIALGAYGNVHNARGILSALFLQTGIPISRYGSGGTLRADLGEGVTGHAVLNFYTQFADQAKVSYTWNSSLPDSRQAFATGDLALYLGYASEARTLAATNPNLNFNVAHLPQPSTANVKSTYGLVYAFMIARGAKNPSGAYQAAVFLSKSDTQTIASTMTGLAPATRTALTTPPPSQAGTVAYTSALYARSWLSPAPILVDQVFSSMIGNVVTGRLEPGAALNRATAALSLLLQQ